MLRLVPHFFLFRFSINRKQVEADVFTWLKNLELDYSINYGFMYLMTFKKEFRNLFYYRVGKYRLFLNIFCSKLNSLHMPTKFIGEGLYIEHGFSTIIAAEAIGENCWINQQVTIGYKNKTEGALIGHNVKIYAGAIVVGGINIGNNVIIGAGSVVTKSIPKNCVVVGNPARIIERNGEKVNLPL